MPTPDPIAGNLATFKKDATALTPEVLGWQIDPKGGEDRYASDKTSGHRVAWPTINDYDAKVRIKIPATGNVPFNRGDTFSAEFHIDNSGSNYYIGNVVVLHEPVAANIGDEGTLELEYALGPRGPLTHYGILWGGAGSSGIPNSGA
jgi:hypothetical protein